MNGGEFGKRPDSDGTIRTTSHKCIPSHLQLTDKGGVPLQYRLAFPVIFIRPKSGIEWATFDLPCASIPDSHTGVQTACCNPCAVKCDGIYLTVVTLKGVQTSSFRDAPHLSCGVVTARNH